VFVVIGSPTTTAIVDTAGDRSQWAHLTTAVMVLVVLLLLTSPLSLLPTAVLAAIVFLVGIQLIDVRGLREIRADRPGEFALATAATIVGLGVEDGIIVAVVLSLIEHVRHSYRPHVAVIACDAAGHWRLDESVSGRIAESGLMIFWFGADLFYANVGFFIAQVRRVIRDSRRLYAGWSSTRAPLRMSISRRAGRRLNFDVSWRTAAWCWPWWSS